MKFSKVHNLGHWGCCRGDGNFEGEIIDEGFGFNFIPDKAQPMNEPADASNFRGKRRLTADEYEYYYRMLDGNSISLPAKVAIAIVLAADLKRLYPATPKLQKDAYLESFISELAKLSDNDKKKVYGEVYAFDYYLVNSTVADFLPSNVVPYEASAYDFQKLIEAKTAEQDVLDQIRENKLQQDARYQKFKMEESQRVASSEFDAGYTDRMAKFITENIDLFLKNMFSDEFNMLAWSEAQLKEKERLYQDVLNRVALGSLKPDQAVEEYRKLLNNLRLVEEQKAELANYAHPILKYVNTKG